jgi:caa(3)-type oxidase subunit IV
MDLSAERQKNGVTFVSYAVTYAVLLVLASLSLVLSRFHFGAGTAVALAIAGIKACAVLWVFMHLVEQRASSRFAVLLAVSLMVILIGLTTVDVDTRHTFPAKSSVPPSSSFYTR